MPINSKSYSDLYSQAKDDLRASIGISGALGRLVLIPIATVLAGLQKVMYSSIVQANRNVLPDLADDETLIRHGKIRLGRTPYTSTQGEYECSVVGEIGAIIEAGTTYTNSKSYVYVIDTTFTFSNTEETITLRSITGGVEAQLEVGTELKSTQPIADVDPTATVSLETVTPIEAESIEEYRENVIKSYSRQPQGGSRSDYREWTEGVEGVREVYPYVKAGYPAEIDLIIEAIPSASVDGLGTPTQAILDAVLASIEPDKEPLGVAEIHYLPPFLTSVDVVVYGLLDPSLLTSIRNSIESVLYSKRPFIAGDDLLTDEFKGFITISDIFEAVKLVVGGDFSNTTLTVKDVELNSYEFINDEIPYLRNLTYVN